MREQSKTAGGASEAGTSMQSGSAGAPAQRRVRDGSVLLRSLIDSYMQAYEGRDRTRAQRLAFWSERLGHVPVGQLVDDDVADALDELAQRRGTYFVGRDAEGKRIFKAKAKLLTGSTVNRYSAALSAVLTWAEKRRLLPRGWVNPLRTVEKRQENRPRDRFLTRDEIDRLLAACAAQKWPMLRVLVLAAISTGCRRGELQGLRWGDIDLESRLITLTRTKNGDARKVPMTEALVAALKPHVGAPSALVFASRRVPAVAYNFEAQWKAALRAAGIRGFVFHGLRHSAASHLVMGGASLHEVGQVLGHRTSSMSARYSHLATEHKALLVQRVLGNIGTTATSESPTVS